MMPKETVYDGEFVQDAPVSIIDSEAVGFANGFNYGTADDILARPTPGHWITITPLEVGAAVKMLCTRCAIEEIHARKKDNRGVNHIEGYAAFYRVHLKCPEVRP
jgi:hypothetical protein